MRRALLVLWIATATVAPAAGVTTKFRCPLSTCSSGVIAWFDHTRTVGTKHRFDGVTNFQYDQHDGTDFPKSSGTSIYAAAYGELYYNKTSCPDTADGCGNGLGNHVRIKHADGVVTIYAT